MNKIRPWYGHDDHFHVRLDCPEGATLCEPQEAAPPGDGCGDDLAWWFTDEPYKPSDKPAAGPLTLDDLPNQCTTVVQWK